MPTIARVNNKPRAAEIPMLFLAERQWRHGDGPVTIPSGHAGSHAGTE